MVARRLRLEPVEIAARNNRESRRCSVVPGRDQARQEPVAHVQVRADDIFDVVPVSPRAVVRAVITKDTSERAVARPAQQVATFLRAVVSPTVRVNIRLEIIQTGVDHGLD